MSQAYQRFAKRKGEGNKKQPAPKYNIHKISFDDSQDSSRSDIPNIYLAERSESEIPSLPMRQKKRDPPPPPPKQKDPPFIKQESLQELQARKQIVKAQNSPKKRIQVIDSLQPPSNNHSSDEAQSSEQQQIPEPQLQIQPHTSLSIFEIIKLYLGQYLFRNPFPMKKAIYINNNNQEENQQNKKQFEIKFKNDQKEISHFDNTLTVSKGLFFTVLAIRNVFTYFYIYAWIAVLVIQTIAESYMLNGPIQYGTQKGGLVVLIIMAIILQLIADLLSARKRRLWQQNKRPYKVYHHNGKMAQWANIKAHELRPGHIYKVSPGEYVPTDCVLLHSQHSLVHIKQNHIISGLVESVSEVVLKETLIKGQSVNLPFSGVFSYQISNPQYSDFQIIGKLTLQEPNQATHPVSMSQIILRGSINYSDVQILCFAMQTGIDSILLKNLQYPYQHLKSYQESPHVKQKVISDQISLQIKEKENTLIGVPIQKKVQSAVYAFTFIYLFASGLGVLVNFFYRLTTGNEFYLSQKAIPIANILVYHITNFIIFIPILLIPLFKLFVLLSGSIAQSNISKRPVDLIPDNDKSKRTTSFSGMKENKQQLLDNKKIIFPVRIKDHNILHQLSNIDTIITTIDTFRDQSAYTLHSIKVKEIMHNFANATNADMYSIQDVEEIKRFMSFAVLTTTKDQYDESYYFDDGIQLNAKKYLDLKKVKNAFGQLLINNEQIKVKHIFTIKATHQYPYKVVFLEPSLEEHEENPQILVLIRGDTKTILDKAYGKQIALTIQSRKLHEEKDFYVELLAKTSMKMSDALEIQRAYNSNSIQKTFFYKNFDKYISKVQPMGLLIFVNNFFQKKVGDTMKNPVLNKSIISQYKYTKPEVYDADIYASQHLPTLIVLSPPSKSSQPEFQSIHTIKNLLTNSYLFNFSLSQVSQKIVQEKPNNLQKMMDKLQTERVLVWDGWDQKDITYTIDIMKKYGKKVLFYIQKDQYMYLMKETDCSVKGSQLGYDSNKYSDITLSSRSSISYFYLMQLIRYDALVIKQGLLSIFFTQLSKFIFYLVVEFINFFYTRGTGLAIIKTPLYLVVEITLAFDIFYYLNWSDSMRSQTFNKKDIFSTEIVVKGFHTVIQGIFIILISFYSLQNPPDSTGTAHSYHFPYFIIVFVFVHILVLQKLFNMFTYSLSIYKMLVMAVQIVIIYLGFIIVSATDTYGFKSVLWNSLNGKKFITAVICIWICLTLPAIRMLLHLLRNKGLKKTDKARKTF